MTRDEASALVERVLALATADEVTVGIEGGVRTHHRFAGNQITTSGTDRSQTVRVSATFGTRTGTASGNQLDEASLKDVVARAEALARVAPEDPEHVPVLGAVDYPAIDAWRPSEDPDAAAAGIARCIAAAEAEGLVAAGFVLAEEGFEARGTSAGNFGYHRETAASVTTTFRTPDGTGSGWANRAAARPEDLAFDELAATARDKAVASVGVEALEPGRYPAVLEPAAVATLLGLLVSAMDARRADEGRSFFSKPGGGSREGEALFPARISVRSDPALPANPARPWGGDGLLRAPQRWIDEGRIAALQCGRFWAEKSGRAPLPAPGNLEMAGEDRSLDELVAGLDRGVLVTRLWYVRSLDPRSLRFTGLTRDGVFWVEGGRVRHPVTNFRWNDSPVDVFAGAKATSRAVRVAGRGHGSIVAPALHTEGFTLASVSDAV